MIYWNAKDLLIKFGEEMSLPVKKVDAEKKECIVHKTAIIGFNESIILWGRQGGGRFRGKESLAFRMWIWGILLEVGAKVVALDNNNDTPLRYVAAYGEKECVALLLDYGADITLQDKDSDMPIDGAKLQN
uniref:Ankyrin repeat domain-containing protein n=1 Tax=Lactuca sativa TaxID=4236 RepID=A0A9R1UHF9_LACSA|nr:hypothetical protein LSAT_V11C900503870 [Lactuca sativa]